jgi:hypothetical protein
MLDDMMDYLKTIREQPFMPLKDEALKVIQSPLSREGDARARQGIHSLRSCKV